MKETALKRTRHLLVILITLLFASQGFSASMRMGVGKELSYETPVGWHHQRTGGHVEIARPGIKLMLSRIPLKNEMEMGMEFRIQNSIDTIVRGMTLRYAMGSLEKQAKIVPLKGVLGSYASFTDASLVGKANSPGSYKTVTSGVIKYGSFVVNFTLLSNSLDSKLYKKAFSIVTSLDYHDVAPGPTAVDVPGEKWRILFEAPLFDRVDSGPTEEGIHL